MAETVPPKKEKKKRKPVKLSAYARMGIPARFQGYTIDDIPDKVKFKKSVEAALSAVREMISTGSLIVLEGDVSSGRDVAAFIIAKAIRAHYRHGYCVDAADVMTTIGSFDGELERERFARLHFFCFYDVNPANLRDFEARIIARTTKRFLDDCGCVILTTDDLDAWSTDPFLNRLHGFISRFDTNGLGVLIECKGVWEPKGSGSQDIPILKENLWL